MIIRTTDRQEIEEIRKIDRREVVKGIYYDNNGQLVLKEEFYNIKGWSNKELDFYIEKLYDLHDRGGIFYGVFQDDKMIGLIALECEFIGNAKDQLQVVFLHVDVNYRDQGIGTTLMNKVKKNAKKLGAKKLYITATPSEHTVNFYINLGCKLATEINPKLFELEPDDIHLELVV